MKNPKGLSKFGTLFEKYIESLGHSLHGKEVILRLFTTFNYPDTVLYIAFEDGEAVGFLYAEPDGDCMWVKEFFSDAHGIGEEMFYKLTNYCEDKGFKCIKGLVAADQAQAMMRHLGLQVEAYLLKAEIRNE